MSAAMDRQTFRETVAHVAAKAKETLPECNGRVEKAVALVLAGDVAPQADGTITVGSCVDPLSTHRLSGTSCSCDDFQYGRAPHGGWCKHRIAAGLHKRVGQLLAEQGVPTSAPAPCPEALFSLTLKGKLDGIETLLTVRGMTAAEFKANVQEVRGLLDTQMCASSQAGPSDPKVQAPPAAGWCAIHDTALYLNHGKNGTTWYSHKLPEGGFCKGRT